MKTGIIRNYKGTCYYISFKVGKYSFGVSAGKQVCKPMRYYKRIIINRETKAMCVIKHFNIFKTNNLFIGFEYSKLCE